MKVAILGFGTVGRGAYDTIMDGRTTDLTVKRVLDIRISAGYEDVMTTNYDDILSDPEIGIVAEVIGGLHPAYEFVTAALKAGKHVVSANKQLISHYYAELTKCARENGVQLRFTPSAGGGIPWLYNLLRAKRCDEIEEVSGILNGTTNYILYNMTEYGQAFDDVLKDAQQQGYAEANPAADIDGLDVQRKCAISANIAYDTIVNEDEVQVFGIRNVQDVDISAFNRAGKVCKLMARSVRHEDSISAYVEPLLLSPKAPESAVPSNFNMVTLCAKRVGRLSFFGQGAGKDPTGSALVQDMLDIANGIAAPIKAQNDVCVDNGAEVHPYYVRMAAGVKNGRLAGLVESSDSDNGQMFYWTKPVSVKDMHTIADEIIKADPNAFFAGVC